MSLVLALFVLCAVLVIGFGRRQAAAALNSVVLLSLCLPILILMVPDTERFVRGITGPGVSMWLFTGVIGIAAALCLTSIPSSSWLPLILPGLLWLSIGLLTAWPRNSEVLAGVFHWCIAFAALIVGIYVGMRSDSKRQIWQASFISALFVFELVLSVYQIVSGEAEQFFGRSFGTFGHPAFVGKFALLSLIFILPLLNDAGGKIRFLGWIALISATATTVLTQSRANTLSIAAVLLLWAIWLPRGAVRGLRTNLIGGLVFASAFTIPLMMERFLADPDGGDRHELFVSGMNIVETYLVSGTGPNRFATVGSNTERIIAETGYPIHNSWMLMVGELGVIGAVLIALPLLVAIGAAARAMRASDRDLRLTARTFLLVAAGAMFIGFSGWGMIQEPTLQMIFFVSGYALGRMRRQAEDTSDVTEGRLADLRTPPLGSTRRMGTNMTSLGLRKRAPRSRQAGAR